MSVTIPTKDMGDVQDKRDPNAEFKKTLSDRNEDYIKKELNVK